MRLTVNGEGIDVDGSATIPALLSKLGVRPERVAVLVNDEVVPEAERDARTLRDGDRLEVLTFAGGG